MVASSGCCRYGRACLRHGSDDDVGCRARTSNVTLDNGKGINKAKDVNNNFPTRQDILYQLSPRSIPGRIIFFVVAAMSHYDEASNFSDFSSLDGSDEFGRKLLQHTKDAQRIQTLTQSQAFRKAKPLPRAALNLDNLERNNLHNPSSYSPEPHHPASASGSTASDPPLNPPRAWGRKGRPNHSWMRSIHDEGPSNIHSSPNIDWADAANASLHSPPHVSPAQRRAHVVSKQAIVEQQDSYIDQWDPDQDFSAASLLVSTPGVPSRSRLTIDQIREREIHTYESRVTSSTRRQAHQQSTNETISLSQRDRYTAPSSAQGLRRSVSNKENITQEPRHSARSLYKTVEASASMPSITPRPAQRKTDSLALLKRLSRTPSASPSPTSAQNPAPPLVTPSRPAERQLPAKTPVVMGAWVDTPQTARQSSASTITQTKRQTSDSLQPIAESSHQRTISEPNLPASALDAVLKDIRDGKRREEDDPTLGDSTIASLEEVMAPSADNTMRLDLPDVPSAQPESSKSAEKQNTTHTDNEKRPQEQEKEAVDTAPTSQQDRDLRQRWFALEGLKKRMGGTSAKAEPKPQAKHNTALDEAIASASTGSKPRMNNVQNIHQHTTGTQCAQCGRPTSVLRAAWNEYWGWYFRRDARAPLGFRLTWLGLLCTTFWTWLLTEWILSSIVSPPRYATRMRGYGVDPHAPRFPYVLPTLVSRPLMPILSPLVSSTVWLWKIVLGQQKYKYYPASPGAWGSAAKVKIGPPGPRSAYYASSNAADDVQWREESTAQAWHAGESAQKIHTWSDSQAWEAEGSMLDDELLL
ncbi:hypothetical protein D6D06_02253 [Aureobasidium pullulans]|nr:hypothetical protein D6D06_02253 [Aureobasidium pullulans]